MREALRKAGIVSSKEARQSEHQERVRRKQLGHEGLKAEQRQRAEQSRKEQEQKRARDRQVERERQARLESAQERLDVVGMIASGLVQGAGSGSKQYFFTLPSGQITYLELSDSAYKSLQAGSAAIVESSGAVPSQLCVVSAQTARALQAHRPEVVLELVPPGGDRPRR
jgi:uncharacterized protein YaiL (DUF2058 family)